MIRRFAVALGIAWLAARAEPVSAWEWTTHTNISNQAIQAAATSDYPDLQQFGQVINDNTHGFNAEVNAHGSWSNFWTFGDGDARPNGDLQKQMLTQYKGLQFTGNLSPIAYSGGGAYAYVGALAHLVEDGASPPHAGNIPHGLADGIESYTENNQSRLAPSPSAPLGGLDAFGYYQRSFSNTASQFAGWTVNIPLALQQTSPPWPSPEAYWVANPQYSAATFLTTRSCRGIYGGGPSTGR